MMTKQTASLPTQIEVRGGRVHNLKNVDVNIPLHKFVAISGLSGSGKSSLAMGILYEEGARRYLEALSTYTRRRIKLGAQAEVTSVKHIPSALALKQRPAIPSERATVGTMSEIFNVIRLIFSRLGSPRCPNGHQVKPSLAIAEAMSKSGDQMGMITCPTCGVSFPAFSAEDFAFNSAGACENCQGTGVVREIDESKLIGDPNLSLADGAVASWHLPGRNFMPSVAEQAGVRIHVPYKDLTDKEKEFVLNGPKKKFKMDFRSGTGRVFHDFNALYENAHEAIYESARTSKSERAQKRISEFFHYSTCPVCHGTRLKPALLTQLAGGLNIAQVSGLTLGDLTSWKKDVLGELPANMGKMAHSLFKEFDDNLRPLLELGLDYLTLSRNGNTLSTGELQRIQLARTLRTQTTGVLYILDEPSIGLHPDNVTGLLNVFRELVDQGNSLVVVDHNVDIIKAADWIIEIGPGSGAQGGRILDQGTPTQIAQDPDSKIGPYLNGSADLLARPVVDAPADQEISFEVAEYYNLTDLPAGSRSTGSVRSPASPGPGRPAWSSIAWYRRSKLRPRDSACPSRSSSLMPPSRRLSVSMPPRSVRRCGQRLPPTPASWTTCVSSSRPSPAPRRSTTRRVISPTTISKEPARTVAVAGSSPWISSSCLTCSRPAPSATVTATTRPSRRSSGTATRLLTYSSSTSVPPCPSSRTSQRLSGN